ncbi:unnamed protein product, partial [marine sediment metagenome]
MTPFLFYEYAFDEQLLAMRTKSRVILMSGNVADGNIM